MNAETTDLARRAVACRGWEWLPGCRDMGGNVYLGRRANAPDGVHQWAGFDRGGWEWHVDEFGLPDLDDAATLGCLLALVRRAWGDPCIYVGGIKTVGGGTAWFVYGDRGSCLASGPTEAAALVAALEAAPC